MERKQIFVWGGGGSRNLKAELEELDAEDGGRSKLRREEGFILERVDLKLLSKSSWDY